MKHQDILDKLTLEQKIALLSGRDVWSTYPFPKAGVPSMFLSDGPHGVRKQLGEGDHLGINASQPATCFPTAAGIANSWDEELATLCGRTIGEEAACQQVNVLLGPGLNTKRSPLGGRDFEYYSEDPYLGGKMAAAFIRGVQENGISACPKHFAANSQELLRMSSDSVVDERTLREIYLTGFEIAVKEGHPRSIMSSYNKVNGTYANENAHLLTEILRDEWGFDGFVVTDWGGCNSQTAGIKAGSNLEMPGTIGDSDRELMASLKAGKITEGEIDLRVDQLLDVILATHEATAGGKRNFDQEAHHAVARQAAVQLAGQADVVLLYLGLPEIFESEGMDRTHMRLPANQNRLLEAVAAANPKVVVVLSGGSPVELPWYDKAAAIVHGYLGGQAGAGAMADILTGKVNPSGKLAETYPLVYDDTPNRDFFPGRELTAQYRESIFVGYRYYLTAQKVVRFPFGFGLSYTTFAYSDLKADKEKVTFTLTNTGKRAGAEVAQLYVSRPDSQLFTPLRELKGFAKVFLQPGESRTVTISLDDKAFRYFNVKTNRWEIEGGTYLLQVGSSAADILLTAQVEVEGTGSPIPYDREKLSCYYSAQVQAVPDDQFTTLLGRPIPQDKWDRSRPLGYNDSLSQMIYAKGFVARFAAGRLAAIQRKSEEKDQPNLNVLFIHSMPFRGLAKMSNGLVTTEMTASILEACNGHFFRGLGKTIAGFFANGKVKKERSKKL